MSVDDRGSRESEASRALSAINEGMTLLRGGFRSRKGADDTQGQWNAVVRAIRGSEATAAAYFYDYAPKGIPAYADRRAWWRWNDANLSLRDDAPRPPFAGTLYYGEMPETAPAPESAPPLLPKSIIQELLRGGHEIVPAGPQQAGFRALLMRAIGKPVQQSQAGVTVVKKALAEYLGVDTNRTGYGAEEEMRAKLAAMLAAHESPPVREVAPGVTAYEFSRMQDDDEKRQAAASLVSQLSPRRAPVAEPEPFPKVALAPVFRSLPFAWEEGDPKDYIVRYYSKITSLPAFAVRSNGQYYEAEMRDLAEAIKVAERMGVQTAVYYDTALIGGAGFQPIGYTTPPVAWSRTSPPPAPVAEPEPYSDRDADIALIIRKTFPPPEIVFSRQPAQIDFAGNTIVPAYQGWKLEGQTGKPLAATREEVEREALERQAVEIAEERRRLRDLSRDGWRATLERVFGFDNVVNDYLTETYPDLEKRQQQALAELSKPEMLKEGRKKTDKTFQGTRAAVVDQMLKAGYFPIVQRPPGGSKEVPLLKNWQGVFEVKPEVFQFAEWLQERRKRDERALELDGARESARWVAQQERQANPRRRSNPDIGTSMIYGYGINQMTPSAPMGGRTANGAASTVRQARLAAEAERLAQRLARGRR